ncbi:MAG: tRNA(Ile)-lysidine synthase [Pseudonocardiales bacterium]|nr:tRNA(Ile)-lysidine synthase [Pseudonocardiales bacterium]
MGGPALAVAEVRRAVRPFVAALRRDPPYDVPHAGHDRVMVACSGGADSLALAAAVSFEAARAGVPAGLITVDHGLQRGSAERADLVAAIGYEMGLDPVEVVRVAVGRAGGPEAAARTARYAALAATAGALDAQVMLGHTLDDQAETVLLGLGRGSGPRSIAGMAAVDGRYLRPLLGLRRETTAAACSALGLPVWTDPHNSDAAFQRARLRHEVLPLLDGVLQGGVAEALARTAALLRDDLDALDVMAADALLRVVRPRPGDEPGKHGQSMEELDVASVASLPRALRTRVLRLWVATAGAAPLTAERTEAVDALVSDWHGQGPIDLPGRVAVHRASGRLVLTAEPQE